MGRFQKGHKTNLGKKLIGSGIPKDGSRNKSWFSSGHKTNIGKHVREETKLKISLGNKGKKMSLIHKEIMRKIALERKGEKSGNWKGGITPVNEKIRHSLEYKLVRKACFERDNWTCVFCGKRGGQLNADHIKPFALFPELRFALDNLRTLCEPCHRNTPTYGGKIHV